MTGTARHLADHLLDAQVAYLLAELSPDRLPEVLARAVDDLLDLAGTMVLDDVVDADHVKTVVRRIAEDGVGSPLVADLVEQFADALFALPASDDHDLGAVVPRERVEALVEKVLAMRTMHERVLDRLAESPAVSVVASKFVSRIIADFVAQNRAMAEKLPGMSSLLTFGGSAASRVRNPFDQVFGDAAGRSASYAIRRTNSAARDVFDEAPLHDAAMEVWDLHAQERVGELRAYLADADLRELAVLIYALVLDVRNSEFFGEVLDACVDVFTARYGQWDLASLLAELGVDRDRLAADLTGFVAPLVEAANDECRLAALVRARLAPFFHSPAVLALLAEPDATPAAGD